MANVTINELNENKSPSLLDELALYTTSKDTTEKTTLENLKSSLGVTSLENSLDGKMNKQNPEGTGTFTHNGNIIPSNNQEGNLGTASAKWSSIHAKEGSFDNNVTVGSWFLDNNGLGEGEDHIISLSANNQPIGNFQALTVTKSASAITDVVNKGYVDNQMNGKMNKNNPIGTGTFQQGGNILPSGATYNLGSQEKKWNKIYLNNELSLGSWKLNSAGLNFGDTSIINYSSNTITGNLDKLQLKDNLKFSQSDAGVYGVDSSNAQFPLIMYNGANIWIGASRTGSSTDPSTHFFGGTHISSGWDSKNKRGYPTIFVDVPQENNQYAKAYQVVHSGIWPFVNRDRGSNFTRSANLMYGVLGTKNDNEQQTLTIFCPLPLINESFNYDTGATTNPISLANFLKIVKNLTINVGIPGGVYFKHSKDSDGNTASNISGANRNIIEDSKVVKAGAISRWLIQAHTYTGFRFSLTFKKPLTTSATGTTEVPAKTSFVGWVTYQLDLSQAPTT